MINSANVIWVDSRVGSKELLPLLLAQGVRAELATLDSADFAFEGQGPNGDETIGIERKTLGDLVSSLKDGRLQGLQGESSSGQLGRLAAAFDYVWLLVEGDWTADAAGRLCQRRHHGTLRPVPGGLTEDSLTKRLLSLEMIGSLQTRGGFRVKQTSNPRATAAWVASLHRWWTDKSWTEHATLHTRHTPQSVHRLSRFREIAMTLPGLGLAGSKAIEHHTNGNALVMLQMPAAQWAEVSVETPAGPRRLGLSKGEQIAEACRKLTGGQ